MPKESFQVEREREIERGRKNRDREKKDVYSPMGVRALK